MSAFETSLKFRLFMFTVADVKDDINPDEERKLILIIFTFLCGASKGFMKAL